MTRTHAQPFPKPPDLGSGPERFPLDVLPPSPQRVAANAARAFPVALDLIAAPMLAAASAAIGATRVIQHKGHHAEHAALWLSLVAGPGHKKSPAMAWVTAPCWQHDAEAHAAWLTAKAAAEAASETDRRVPPRVHYALSDSTIEAVAEVLDVNQRGFLLNPDELSGFARGMDQYKPGGKGSERQAWLSIWSRMPLVVKRRGRDPLTAPSPFVTIVGTIQPDVLHDLSTGRSDGFLDRMLFAFPVAEPFQSSREDMDPGDRGAWHRIIHTLYSLMPDADGKPIPLSMTPEARTVFFAWHEAVLEQARSGDVPEHLHGLYGKAEGHALRFALILELLAWADGVSPTGGQAISAESITGAGRLFAYFLDHQARVRDHLGGDPDERKAAMLLDWMHRKDKKRVTLRDVQNGRVARVRRKQDVEQLFRLAEELGLGNRIQIPHQSGGESPGFEAKA